MELLAQGDQPSGGSRPGRRAAAAESPRTIADWQTGGGEYSPFGRLTYRRLTSESERAHDNGFWKHLIPRNSTCLGEAQERGSTARQIRMKRLKRLEERASGGSSSLVNVLRRRTGFVLMMFFDQCPAPRKAQRATTELLACAVFQRGS